MEINNQKKDMFYGKKNDEEKTLKEKFMEKYDKIYN